MAVPTILPTEATPLDIGKKRRYSEVVDLTGEDHTTATGEQQPPAITRDHDKRSHEVPSTRKIEDKDIPDDESDTEELEDQLDESEMNPWADITDGTNIRPTAYRPRG